MSFWNQIEADFNAVVSSAETLAAKLEALVSIQGRASAMITLTNQVAAIIEDSTKSTLDKVTEILILVEKL